MKTITEQTLRQAVKRLSKTDDGKIFIAALKQACNWDLTVVGSDPIQTHFHAAKRSVYGGIRHYIEKKELSDIEYNYKIVQEKTDDE